MISMLMPASASASNMSAATPGWLFIPAPISDTFAMSGSRSTRLAPISVDSASRMGSAIGRSVFGSVNVIVAAPSCETFCTIMSTLTPARARSRNTFAATPGRSGMPMIDTFASEVSWVTPEMIAFSSMTSSSSPIQVPSPSTNVERTRSFTP